MRLFFCLNKFVAQELKKRISFWLSCFFAVFLYIEIKLTFVCSWMLTRSIKKEIMGFLDNVLKVFVGDKSKKDIGELQPLVDEIKKHEAILRKAFTG